MQIGTYTAPGTIGWIIALEVLLLAIVALFGGIAITPHLLLVLIASLAMSRLL